MCGLVGVAGDCGLNFKDIFTDLLIIDSVRGCHSTGAAAVSRWKSEVRIEKQPGGPHNLVTTSLYNGMLQMQAKALIGHNRHATVGEHTVENAHPFKFDHIVGAHNGTLDKSSHRALPDQEKYGTDSEAIFASINNNGLRKTVDLLQGAWALVWYDSVNNTINFLRNDKRPLFYVYSKDRCTLVWASEVCMLNFIISRARMDQFDEQIYRFDPDEHYSWEIPDSVNKKFTAPERLPMKAPDPPPIKVWSWEDQAGGGRLSHVPFVSASSRPAHGTIGRSSKGTSTNSGVVTADFRQLRVKKFRPPYKNSNGQTINKKKFEELVHDGCVFCGDQNVNWGQFIFPMQSVDGDVFLCEECYLDEDVATVVSQLM